MFLLWVYIAKDGIQEKNKSKNTLILHKEPLIINPSSKQKPKGIFLLL